MLTIESEIDRAASKLHRPSRHFHQEQQVLRWLELGRVPMGQMPESAARGLGWVSGLPEADGARFGYSRRQVVTADMPIAFMRVESQFRRLPIGFVRVESRFGAEFGVHRHVEKVALIAFRAGRYRNKGEYDSAIADFTAAIRPHPKYAESHINCWTFCDSPGALLALLDRCSRLVETEVRPVRHKRLHLLGRDFMLADHQKAARQGASEGVNPPESDGNRQPVPRSQLAAL